MCDSYIHTYGKQTIARNSTAETDVIRILNSEFRDQKSTIFSDKMLKNFLVRGNHPHGLESYTTCMFFLYSVLRFYHIFDYKFYIVCSFNQFPWHFWSLLFLIHRHVQRFRC